jgi:hypothetical protein
MLPSGGGALILLADGGTPKGTISPSQSHGGILIFASSLLRRWLACFDKPALSPLN